MCLEQQLVLSIPLTGIESILASPCSTEFGAPFPRTKHSPYGDWKLPSFFVPPPKVPLSRTKHSPYGDWKLIYGFDPKSIDPPILVLSIPLTGIESILKHTAVSLMSLHARTKHSPYGDWKTSACKLSSVAACPLGLVLSIPLTGIERKSYSSYSIAGK